MALDDGTVEARLLALETTVAELQRRLVEVELARPRVERPVGGAVAPDAAGDTLATDVDAVTVLPLVGRTFMVFGGAYLLRALTDSGRLPAGGGVLLGLLYALVWLVAAHRAGAHRRLSAAFHGATAVAVAVPLIVEATTRFALLAPWAGAIVLGAFSGLALLVAWHRTLHSLAAVAMVATLGASVYLAGASSGFVPFSLVLTALGVATLWLGYHRDWFWMRWVVALVADVAMIGLTTRAIGAPPREAALPVIAAQLLLVGLYLGSFAARTLWKGRALVPFEVAQTVAALAVGLGGALAVASASGAGTTSLGVGSLAFGAGAYAVAFAFVGRRQGLGANFYFYATLALLLTSIGAGVLFGHSPGTLGVVLSLLAVASAWLGRRSSRNALVLHAAIYCLMAAATSGLLPADMTLMAGKAGTLWPTIAAAAWVSWLAAVACALITLPARGEESGLGLSLTRLGFIVLALVGVFGAVLLAVGPILAGTPPDAGMLATVRTGLLAGAAVLLAAATHAERLAELRWLVYPVLALAAFKLLVEDMRLSQSATLFVALAMLGGALVLAPRLVRRAAPPTPRRAAGEGASA